MKNLVVGILGAGVVLSAAPAFAGEWRFQPTRCADLVEDHYDRAESRRDERYDYSARDRREDRSDRRESRRDEAITVCPRSSFVYVPSARESKAHGRHYRAPELKLKYDRKRHMYYRTERGRKIYIRG